MTVATTTDLEMATRFVESIGRRDFETMATFLHPDVRFRAFTTNHEFAMIGPAGVVSIFQDWFCSLAQFDLVETSVEPMSDRIRIRYQGDVIYDVEEHTFEQQAYCSIADGLISDLMIICTGPCPKRTR